MRSDHRLVYGIVLAASFLSLQLQARTVVFLAAWISYRGKPAGRSATLDKFPPRAWSRHLWMEAALADPQTLANADLLVLPYGSAVPVEAWKGIEPLPRRGRQSAGRRRSARCGFRSPRPAASMLPASSRTRMRGRWVSGTPMKFPVTRDAEFHWRAGYSLAAHDRDSGAEVLRCGRTAERGWATWRIPRACWWPRR